MLFVLVLGEGVRGIRPPAVRVEKMLWWLLSGVDTATEAIVLCVLYCFLGRESISEVQESQLNGSWMIIGKY